jgi:hypothetical protein
MNEFYVYEHYKPNSSEPFYVGKGRGNRAYQKSGRSTWWHNIVNKHGREVRFVAKRLTELDALWLENICIIGWGRKTAGDGPLVNHTDGGEGMSGWVPTKETRKRWSDQRKGRAAWNKDVSHTEQHKEALSLSWKPRTFTPEYRRKLSAAANKRWALPGAKDRQSSLTKGRKQTSEQIEEKRNRQIGIKHSPERCKKNGDARRGKKRGKYKIKTKNGKGL